MFDAAGEGLQQAGHRSPSFQCTICCSMERALKLTQSMLIDDLAVSCIFGWHKNSSLMCRCRPVILLHFLCRKFKSLSVHSPGSVRICAPSLQLCWSDHRCPEVCSL